MSVEKDVTRKAVNIKWDPAAVQGSEVQIEATNPETGDVSTTDGKNDGFHVLTYPADYTGSTEVKVTGSEGGEDSGTIEV